VLASSQVPFVLTIIICWQISHGKFMKRPEVCCSWQHSSVSPYKFVSWMGTLTIKGPGQGIRWWRTHTNRISWWN